MRDASTYRGARRNAARCSTSRLVSPHGVNTKRSAKGGIRSWGLDPAIGANVKAKLIERRKLCAEANEAVAMALAEQNVRFRGKPRDVVITSALREFWSKQQRTRVVARILRQLGPVAA